jgi:hypothetical protein
MDVQVKIIDTKTARDYTVANHYMKTFPNPRVCFGVIAGRRLSGVLTFGLSPSTGEKVRKVIPDIKDGEYIEMQRMHISDRLGHNTESFVLGKVYELFKRNTKVKVIVTHAGGCKNDCGIVYQASAWLYFGKEKCDDFYLTEAGEYRNIIAPLRFGRVPKGIKGGQQVGEYLFGPGELIHSYRYLYLYPLQKGLRKWLQKKAMAYPKDSEVFRRNQAWVETT